MIFDRFTSSGRRQRLAAKAPEGPLRRYLETPFPDDDLPLDELPLLAIDIETTGLDPAADELLSIGFLPLDGGTIDLAGARHLIVRGAESVGQSASIHGITDDRLATGVPLEEALGITFEALTGRVLLAHFDRIETGFLGRLAEQKWGVRPTFSSVDTMLLQAGILSRHSPETALPPGAVRLWASRERYGLPIYRAHEALTDALACAELYLAQAAELQARTLRELRRFSR